MAAKTSQHDSAADVKLFDALNEIRLSRDWSYRELADDIQKVTGLSIASQTLHQLLSPSAADRPGAYDRTLYKLRQYLSSMKDKAPKKVPA